MEKIINPHLGKNVENIGSAKSAWSRQVTGLIGEEMYVFGADYSAVSQQIWQKVGLLLFLYVFHVQ